MEITAEPISNAYCYVMTYHRFDILMPNRPCPMLQCTQFAHNLTDTPCNLT